MQVDLPPGHWQGWVAVAGDRRSLTDLELEGMAFLAKTDPRLAYGFRKGQLAAAVGATPIAALEHLNQFLYGAGREMKDLRDEYRRSIQRAADEETAAGTPLIG